MTSETDLQANTPERKCVISSLTRHLSLKHKVVAVIMLTCILALSLVGCVLFAWERTILRRTFVHDLSMHAQVLAENCRAALAFGDRADAMKVLQTADAVPPIMVACVYTADGGLFAAHSREGTAPAVPPAGQLKDYPVFDNGFLVLTRPVLLDGEKIGVVCLKASLDFMRERLQQEALAILGVLLLSSLFACLISSRLQRIVSRPILRLADVARFVAENKQYTIRAEPSGNDEVGLLIRMFNEMLKQIEERDAALTTANENLETRVRERTAELSSANAKLAYLASFPEQNPGPVMEVDLDGNLRYANPATLRLFPDLREQGAAHPWLADWPGVATLFQGEQADTVAREATVAGRSYEQLLHYFAQDRFVRIYAVDITERKRAEENLANAAALLRNIINTSHDFIFLKDLQLRTILCNEAFAKALGKHPEELYGKTDIENGWNPELVQGDPAKGIRGFENDDREALSGQVVHNLSDPANVAGEIRIFDTVKLPLYDASGTIVGVLGVSRDITERRKAEEDLRNSEERFRQVAESAGEFIWEVDLDGLYTYANPEVETILGYKPEEVVGKKHFFDFFPSEIRERLKNEASQVLSQVAAFKRLLNPNVHRNGNTVILETSGMPIVDHQGKLVGYRGVNTDVTERKVAERRQARLLQQLAEINQELADFAYVVSHDLKAPLRAIRTLADWLCGDYQDKFDEQGKENLQLLGNRVDRMQNLIDGVLQYSRIGRTEQEKAPVDLNQLVPQIVESLGAPGHISIHIESGLPTIEADVTRITQVFQNLLSNAIEYMDKPQGNITVDCVEEGAFWKFSVADNGPGIEQKHFDRIFKLFQTLAPRDGRESTGVGLTIVKKIVEMYGGKVWVESQVSQGSTFFFTLPKLQTEVNCVELETVTAFTR